MDSAKKHRSWDVFVIGGGPAGATAAALLAGRGHSVVVADKERHPRFHIGESLLPMNLPILDRLGLGDAVAGFGVKKRGADFTVEGENARPVTMHFRRALGDSPGFAWEVRRAEFDQLLFEAARRAGAVAMEDCEVLEVLHDGGAGFRVRIRDGAGGEREERARFVVDASGRGTVLANQYGWKQRNPRHASAAIFSHYAGVERRPGTNQGNISIYWFEHGWLWMIPLKDDIMSVGAVCRPAYLKRRKGRSPAEFLQHTIQGIPGARERFSQFDAVEPVRVTGNYSYASRAMAGPGFVLLGDAYAFIDPVFSSGVYLAMNSAEMAIPQVEAWLAGDRDRYTAAVKDFERRVKRGLSSFSWFIHRFTTPAMRRLFSNPRNTLNTERGVISLLAGDVFRDERVHRALRVFRGVYFCTALLQPIQMLASWRDRRDNVAHEFT